MFGRLLEDAVMDQFRQTQHRHMLQCLSVNLAFIPTVKLHQNIEFWNTSDLLHTNGRANDCEIHDRW